MGETVHDGCLCPEGGRSASAMHGFVAVIGGPIKLTHMEAVRLVWICYNHARITKLYIHGAYVSGEQLWPTPFRVK